jgi:hypothetical protein
MTTNALRSRYTTRRARQAKHSGKSNGLLPMPFAQHLLQKAQGQGLLPHPSVHRTAIFRKHGPGPQPALHKSTAPAFGKRLEARCLVSLAFFFSFLLPRSWFYLSRLHPPFPLICLCWFHVLGAFGAGSPSALLWILVMSALGSLRNSPLTSRQ